MTDERSKSKPADRLTDLESQAEEARKSEAAAERRADETVKRAEQLEEQSRELGETGEKIRRKAQEPFPPRTPAKNAETPK